MTRTRPLKSDTSRGSEVLSQPLVSSGGAMRVVMTIAFLLDKIETGPHSRARFQLA